MAELNEITKGADKDPNSKTYIIFLLLQIAERTMQQFIKEENRNTIFYRTVKFILPNKFIIRSR